MTRDEAVREAVFRYQIEHNTSALIEMRRAHALFLSVGTQATDPDDGLLKRFEGMIPPVKKVSQCLVDQRQNVMDGETGKRGVIFSLTAMTWLSAAEAVIEGGYYEDDQNAAGHTYRVVHRDDQWIVTEDTQRWTT